MKKDIIDIIRKFHLTNEIKTYDQCADEILRLFSVRKRHLVESILDDVKQSHSEYAIEKIESYLDDGC